MLEIPIADGGVFCPRCLTTYTLEATLTEGMNLIYGELDAEHGGYWRDRAHDYSKAIVAVGREGTIATEDHPHYADPVLGDCA